MGGSTWNIFEVLQRNIELELSLVTQKKWYVINIQLGVHIKKINENWPCSIDVERCVHYFEHGRPDWGYRGSDCA